ncbi:phage integrase family protein [Pelagimonas varians]|uniref:Site-specific tyrosine recombinase XerD n=1 Tax=Pelagimonas varians TaxID=696760 RepID=A0A238L4E5_9RHOB|nr:phage integrase family protein [Pelagimonas varians]SMX49196.1 site-specific tyrosine recombinase XerD [Pelagimonas varians]
MPTGYRKPDKLRAYLQHLTDTGVSTGVFNARIVLLRFYFGMTCGREKMKRYMQFRCKPKKLPVVLSVEKVGDLLAAVPGPGLKYRAALGISYGAGLRASEVCSLKVSDIKSDRMMIHVEEGKMTRIAWPCCRRLCLTCSAIAGGKHAPRVGYFLGSPRSWLRPHAS